MFHGGVSFVFRSDLPEQDESEHETEHENEGDE
jgi:hypothetical protein